MLPISSKRNLILFWSIMFLLIPNYSYHQLCFSYLVSHNLFHRFAVKWSWLLLTTTTATGMKLWYSLHLFICLFIYLFICWLQPKCQTYKQKRAKEKTPHKIKYNNTVHLNKKSHFKWKQKLHSCSECSYIYNMACNK